MTTEGHKETHDVDGEYEEGYQRAMTSLPVGGRRQGRGTFFE